VNRRQSFSQSQRLRFFSLLLHPFGNALRKALQRRIVRPCRNESHKAQRLHLQAGE
jgi:hypothetical protein